MIVTLLGVPDVPDVLRDVVALRKAVRDELELGRRRGSNLVRAQETNA